MDEKYSLNDMYGRTLLKRSFFPRTYDSAFPFHEEDEPVIQKPFLWRKDIDIRTVER